MFGVHHRYPTVGGRKLSYREAGPTAAHAVVLLHPDGTTWSLQQRDRSAS